jgi:phosphorylated CTD-interacting factor 1
MAKKQKSSKKRSKTSAPTVNITSLCNLSGLQDESDPFAQDVATNELDDCLAMMDQSNVSNESKSPVSNNTSSEAGAAMSTSDDKDQPPQQNILWKGSEKTSHSSKPVPVDFVLPTIQVELARHMQVGDLSTLLLSKCKHLRMPSFERWLIDSKMEERLKRQAIQENAQIQASKDQHDANNISKDAKYKNRLKRKRKELKSSLEQHMTSSGLRALNDYDPCIPSMADVDDEASQQLIQEMEQGDNEEGFDATDLCRKLCMQACNAARQVQNLNHHMGRVNSGQYFGKKSGRIVLETNTESSTGHSYYSLVYTRKSSGEKKAKPFFVKINTEHYDKLRDMFHSVHNTATAAKPMFVEPPRSLGKNPNRYLPATNIFHHLIFCIIVRYASLSGAQQLLDLRGGGMQGAIHSEVFECISKHSQSEQIVECFASPLNAYNKKYFSIFHQDLDWHFGSVGDFFSVPSRFFRLGGVHEVNPPFSPCLMLHMVERMEEYLRFADSLSESGGNCPLTFVIIVPSYSKKSDSTNLIQEFAGKSFKRMLRSKYFVKHIILNARDHGYIEGSQHLRPTRFKESQYDTSAIILQSKDAKEKDEIALETKEFEADLRIAFASRHQKELEERRNEKSATNSDDGDENAEKEPVPEVEVEFQQEKKSKNKQRKKKKKPKA